MKTQKFLFLLTTISSMLFSCSTPGTGSSHASDSSKQGESSSSQQPSSKSSQPTFANLDHVKVFVSKDTNIVAYNTIYAWDINDKPIIGDWPGAALSTYDSDWLSYDFDKNNTSFSIILNTGANGQQTSHSGMPISGKGAYWYYNDSLEKKDTMPDLHPTPTTSTPSGGGGEGGSTTNIENGNIFHAFDWSLNVIKNRINDIASAGYTAIQTSPLQQPKDYYGDSSTRDWWKLYQPCSFNLPTENYYLGNANDLKALTKAAHNKNINIIVDVVANHMGGDGNNPSDSISRYEPAIMNDRGNTFRSVDQCTDWNNRYDVTHKRLGGYPELNTGNTTVQNEVYTYLKELIDCGVDGFRFDAAKHIETPYDNDQVKSSFWTNTATKAYKYAQDTYDKQLYMYGEILDNCAGVPFDYYTNILDGITDNRTGNNCLAGVERGSSSDAARSGYETGMSADKLVVWGESHDTYMNDDGSSKNADQKNVDKAYALMGSRKGSRALYFARPNWNAKLSSGDTQNSNYKNAFITAVNKFKNDMGNNDESVRSEGNIAYVARHGKNGYGATIVNVTNYSGNTTVALTNLPNGTYLDLVSNKTYTMKNGSITVNLSSSYSATVIEKVS